MGLTNKRRHFIIVFTGLAVGKHRYDYVLNDDFFSEFPEQEFRNPRLSVHLQLEKKQNNSMEIMLHLKGRVEVDCDRTSRPFDLELSADRKIIVKLGEQANNDDDELIILPLSEHELDVAHFIYETTVQALPLKRLYPGLEEDEPAVFSTDQQERTNQTDPRWEKLRALHSNDKSQ